LSSKAGTGCYVSISEDKRYLFEAVYGAGIIRTVPAFEDKHLFNKCNSPLSSIFKLATPHCSPSLLIPYKTQCGVASLKIDDNGELHLLNKCLSSKAGTGCYVSISEIPLQINIVYLLKSIHNNLYQLLKTNIYLINVIHQFI
jgi:6-phosphogluconolactonase (cycloisomerase 2 family)